MTDAIISLKKSTDARKRNIKYNIRLAVYTDEDHPSEPTIPAYKSVNEDDKIHIIGFGPAGIFAALKCLEYGVKPII